ncbi:TPA: hypothetical protein N0F65_004899 [Lagenidium giganteum]|uniref:C2 domain-containing protein n=1 Tax=Lagenidium giganteum TaxID=4803 RepID=A0AAV2YJE1_9STRA|nr:TPA: hypothetical protein N0F65_004899 [Lagenidium giganteum]
MVATTQQQHALSTKQRLFFRVFGAEGLNHSSAQGAYCKLYIGQDDKRDGTGVASEGLVSSAKKILTAEEASDKKPCRVFRTTCADTPTIDSPIWDEKFQVDILDPSRELLSIRVKSQRRLFAPLIGAVTIPLGELERNVLLDKWFDLTHGKTPSGRIRIQFHLVEPGASRKENTVGAQTARVDNNGPAVPYVDFEPSNVSMSYAKCDRNTSFASTANGSSMDLDGTDMDHVDPHPNPLYSRLPTLNTAKPDQFNRIYRDSSSTTMSDSDRRRSSLCDQFYINPTPEQRASSESDFVVDKQKNSVYL